MTSTDHTVTRAWPACALGAWAAAWIAGRCSPDDVVDTLALFADRHIVDNHTQPGRGADATGKPGSPDESTQDGTLELLALLRRARRLSVRLPDAGDPQGLPPDPATAAAFESGEVLLIDDGDASGLPIALVPSYRDTVNFSDTANFSDTSSFSDTTIRWVATRYRSSVPAGLTMAAGEIEYELRQSISRTTELISKVGARAASEPTDLRGTLRAQTERNLVELPPHDDARASRILTTAAQIEAIVAVTAASGATFGATTAELSAGDGGLRGLLTLAHTARAAALSRVIEEFLPGGW